MEKQWGKPAKKAEPFDWNAFKKGGVYVRCRKDNFNSFVVAAMWHKLYFNCTYEDKKPPNPFTDKESIICADAFRSLVRKDGGQAVGENEVLVCVEDGVLYFSFTEREGIIIWE